MTMPSTGVPSSLFTSPVILKLSPNCMLSEASKNFPSNVLLTLKLSVDTSCIAFPVMSVNFPAILQFPSIPTKGINLENPLSITDMLPKLMELEPQFRLRFNMP